MQQLRYRLVNVFTRDGARLSGNPLCVFEDASGVSDESMQSLALQFNLSETTFLLPPTESSADARVRIFTPAYEMPFAGHPTLGTAAVCCSLGIAGDSLRLQMQAGVIPVWSQGQRWTLAARPASHRELNVGNARLAELLGLAANDIGERPLWVNAGKEQLIVPLTSPAAVRRAAARPEAFRELLSEDGQGMAYLFAPDGPGRVLARFFFPVGVSVLEDPATGSATANLGGWWHAMQRPLPCSLVCHQGEQVGRPSTLFLDLDQAGRIHVSGDVIEIGRGVIEL